MSSSVLPLPSPSRPGASRRPVRESADGVIAVRDERETGGHDRPWSVVAVPRGHITHYPSMVLTDQAVATWTELVPKGQTS